MNVVEVVAFSYADRIAQRFVAARLNALALLDYPGPIPPDLASGYQCQEEAIKLWPDTIVGWKIGKIPDERQDALGAHRLAGPIFSHTVQRVDSAAVAEVGVFVGGFAAVEAEYVFEVVRDAPAGKTDWTLVDAAGLVGRLYCGVEMAGSPLSTINALGPTVVVSDFGNNADEIIGAEIPDWRQCNWEDLAAEAFIDGRKAGEGGAHMIPGGPLESVQFLAGHLAARGRPLKAGTLISTGAATGIHDIVAGQSARVDFKDVCSINLRAKPRTATTR
jgi:2-keto-4-pentenoate hydratase